MLRYKSKQGKPCWYFPVSSGSMLTVKLSDGKEEHHEAACCERRCPFAEGTRCRRYGRYKAGSATRRCPAHGGKRGRQHVRSMLLDVGSRQTRS